MSVDFVNTVFPYLYIILFTLVLIFLIYLFIRFIKNESYNHRAPLLKVKAEVVSKRREYFRQRRTIGFHYYFVTFEIEGGDRLEFRVDSGTFGVLLKGDQDYLSFKGTDFIDFVRA